MRRKEISKKAEKPRAQAPVSVAEFDRNMVIESFGDPPPLASAKWERAVTKRGRPRRGSGATVISVSVERGLLERADWTARRVGITRSQLIARGLRAVLAATGAE